MRGFFKGEVVIKWKNFLEEFFERVKIKKDIKEVLVVG